MDDGMVDGYGVGPTRVSEGDTHLAELRVFELVRLQALSAPVSIESGALLPGSRLRLVGTPKGAFSTRCDPAANLPWPRGRFSREVERYVGNPEFHADVMDFGVLHAAINLASLRPSSRADVEDICVSETLEYAATVSAHGVRKQGAATPRTVADRTGGALS